MDLWIKDDEPPFKRRKYEPMQCDHHRQPQPSAIAPRSESTRATLDGELQGDSGSHYVSPQSMICYGTLDNVSVQVFGKLDWLAEQADETISLFFQSTSTRVTICSKEGKIVGALQPETGIALLEISSSLPNIHLQAYVEKKQIKARSLPLIICINVYGPSSIASSAGDLLMEKSLFLQTPKIGTYDHQYPHQNPQCFFQDEYMDIDIDVEESEPRAGVFSIKATTFKLRDIFRDILPAKQLDVEIKNHDTSQRIKTPLLEHQSSAIEFMREIENPSLDNSHTGGILADEPGLGKSLTALAFIAGCLPSDSDHRTSTPSLIVVPSSLILPWNEQIQEHFYPAGISTCIYSGPNRSRTLELISNADIVLTSYSTLVADFNSSTPGSAIFSRIWSRIILDEAHFINDRSTKRFQAVSALISRARWCLTGTPIQNKLEDLEALLIFLRCKGFDKPGSFRKKISEPLKRGDSLALQRLHNIMTKLLIRRTKDMIDLPNKAEFTVEVELSKRERSLYDASRKASDHLIRTSTSFDDNRINSSILQSILQQRQIANHGTALLQENSRRLLERITQTESLTTEIAIKEEYPVFCEICHVELEGKKRSPYFEECFHLLCETCISSSSTSGETQSDCPLCNENSKMPRLQPHTESLQAWIHKLDYQGPSNKVRALIKNIEQNCEQKQGLGVSHKTVVFSQWVKMLYLVGRALEIENVRFVRYDGTLSIEQRQRVLSDFSLDPSITVLLITIGTGGVGLNLTAASSVHLLEPHWNPMVERQALDRVHRIGQRSKVTTYRYIAKNTFDEAIARLQTHKLELAQLALSDQENRSKLTSQHLKELYSEFK